MAKLTISSSTDERPDKWWNEKELSHVLHRLPETLRFVSEIYEAFEQLDLDFSEVDVTIHNGEGWCRTGEKRSCDVYYIIEAPNDILVKLLTDKYFRDEYLDGISLKEALTSPDLKLD